MTSSPPHSPKHAKLDTCSLLELVPPHSLCLPSSSGIMMMSAARGGESPPPPSDDEVESHRILVNAKLIELAVRFCTSHALDVLVQDKIESRLQLSSLYNDLWDAALVHGKTHVECRVVTVRNPTTSYVENFNVGQTLCPTCSPVTTHHRILASHLTEETTVPLVLYDNPRQPMPTTLRKIALGGTFDHMHNGHRKLLTVATAVATELIIVGVTAASMLTSKKNASQIESIEMRCAKVQSFLNVILPHTSSVKIEIQVIHDPWGPTITRADLDGIVASSETIKGVCQINEQRVGKGMRPLIPVIVMRSNQYTLSSTFVRGIMMSKG